MLAPQDDDPGLVPGIHVFYVEENKAWMAGTSPAMMKVSRRETVQ